MPGPVSSTGPSTKRIAKLELPALVFPEEEPTVLYTGVEIPLEQGWQHREAPWIAQALDRLDGLGLLDEARFIEHLQGGCEGIADAGCAIAGVTDDVTRKSSIACNRARPQPGPEGSCDA